jgi:predicted small metal-binding protein
VTTTCHTRRAAASQGQARTDGSGFTASAESEEELLDKVAAHAAHDHGVPEVTPELAAKVKAASTHR